MTAGQTFQNTLVVIVTVVAAYALYRSIHILIVLLVAIIIASAARPSVLRLRNWRVPHGMAIILVYIMLAVAIFLLGVVVLPPAVQQLSGYVLDQQRLAQKIIDTQAWFQGFIQQHTGTTIATIAPDQINASITDAIDQVKAAIPTLAGEFGGLLGDAVLVFVMGVYWLTARDQGVKFILQLFPIGRRAMIGEIINEAETAMGTYVRGIGLVCTFVGVANFIILSLLGVPNAVTLGFIVGITTALPIVGGYIGAATATLLALLSSPLHALFAFGSFVAVQQIENHYLTPRVMSQSVGLDPILVIVLLFTGFALGGVIGALLALPVASMITILLRHLYIEPRKDEAAPQFIDGGILIPGKTKEPETPPPTNTIVTDTGARR